MGAQIKKKARSFSLTDEEMTAVVAGTKRHGFKDRNAYLLALVEADARLQMTVELDAEKRRILVPGKPSTKGTSIDATVKASMTGKNAKQSSGGPNSVGSSAVAT